jgi:transposase
VLYLDTPLIVAALSNGAMAGQASRCSFEYIPALRHKSAHLRTRVTLSMIETATELCGGALDRQKAEIEQLEAEQTRLVRVTVELSNQIRGLMKTFGLVVPVGQGSTFEKHVRDLLIEADELARIILPLLNAWRGVRERAAEFSRQLMADARKSEACQILMWIPGIGTVTATSFMAAIEDPDNFRKSRSVAAWLGLTTRRYQSGEVDFDGHISRRGDKHLRGLLYEAAVVILTRSYADSGLRAWGLKLKRAATALARKLAVTIHAMLKSGELFDPTIGATI